MTHMRKSQAYYSINGRLKTETNRMLEERQIQMHSKSMHPAMCLKVNLGVVRALKNVETIYLLAKNNKSEKTQQCCRIGAS